MNGTYNAVISMVAAMLAIPPVRGMAPVARRSAQGWSRHDSNSIEMGCRVLGARQILMPNETQQWQRLPLKPRRLLMLMHLLR